MAVAVAGGLLSAEVGHWYGENEHSHLTSEYEYSRCYIPQSLGPHVEVSTATGTFVQAESMPDGSGSSWSDWWLPSSGSGSIRG